MISIGRIAPAAMTTYRSRGVTMAKRGSKLSGRQQRRHEDEEEAQGRDADVRRGHGGAPYCLTVLAAVSQLSR
jgi:hypothetical protein